ncbi:hypothetical protein Dimus_033436 [Dionaea muscipula]
MVPHPTAIIIILISSSSPTQLLHGQRLPSLHNLFNQSHLSAPLPLFLISHLVELFKSPAMVASATSALNPNAPMFIPMAYRAVEDFSEEWWGLVRSSPWFRDYWLQECFHDPQSDPFLISSNDEDLILSDLDAALFNANLKKQKEERDLIPLGSLKWENNKLRGAMDGGRRNSEKAPKIVNVKVSPRMIHQPR